MLVLRKLWQLVATDQAAVLDAIAGLDRVAEVEALRDAEHLTHGRITVHRHCLRRIRELKGENDAD